MTGGLRRGARRVRGKKRDKKRRRLEDGLRDGATGRLLEKWALAKFGVDVAAEREDASRKKTNDSKNFPFDDADEDAPVVVELSEGTYARMDISSVSEEAEVHVTETASEPGARMGWMVQ